MLLFGGAPLWRTVKETATELPPLVARLVEPEPPKPEAEEKPAPAPAQKPKQPPRSRPVIPQTEPAPAPAAEIAKVEPLPVSPAASPSPVPAPSPPPAPAASVPQDDTPLLISQYGIRLRSETQRQAKYPPAARREGWEGKGELLLVVGEDGKIAELRVVRSSGYALLDRALIDGVRRAQPRVEIPSGLRGRRFQLALPFVMNLINE